MTKYIKTDGSETGSAVDDADTEGHKIRWIEDADPEALRARVDEADTEGHVRMRNLEGVETEPTQGAVDHGDTEGHVRLRP